MMRSWVLPVTLILAPPALAEGLPVRIGQCAKTTVKQVEERLMDGATNQPTPGSGSAIEFANGGYQVSYEQEPAVDRSRPGDPVTMCLVSVPRHCPPGDDRGRMYKTTNLRTRGSWTLPDAEHQCGGA
ncbi:MAG: hypothetical protein WB766_25270 [Roseiarcus sp.]